MRSIFAVFALCALFSVTARATTSMEVEALAERIEGKLKNARYMEQRCQPIVYLGWEDFETQRCTYSVTDPKDGTQKTGLVIMLNPTALKLSTWIISACRMEFPDVALPKCSSHLIARVIDQSGGQFVIAGVVYEDVIPADRVYEAYGFSNGVTTLLKGLQHRNTRPLSLAELEDALTAMPLRTASESAFARITGTTRNEYRSAAPGIDVRGLSWLAEVRSAYQEAWRGDHNSLMEAWLRKNPPQ